MDNKISDRIKQVIDAKGMSIAAFEKSVDLSNGTLQKAILRGSDVVGATLRTIVLVHDVSADWLLTGRGDMFNKPELSIYSVGPPDPMQNLEERVSVIEKRLGIKKKKTG